jgi:transposase
MSTYRRKRWGSKDRRREAAVRLRAEGMSLREIAARLKVSKDTVMRDLAVSSGVSFFPAGGRKETAYETENETPLPQVIALAERRRA